MAEKLDTTQPSVENVLLVAFQKRHNGAVPGAAVLGMVIKMGVDRFLMSMSLPPVESEKETTALSTGEPSENAYKLFLKLAIDESTAPPDVFTGKADGNATAGAGIDTFTDGVEKFALNMLEGVLR